MQNSNFPAARVAPRVLPSGTFAGVRPLHFLGNVWFSTFRRSPDNDSRTLLVLGFSIEMLRVITF
jgi:hypothetical protein